MPDFEETPEFEDDELETSEFGNDEPEFEDPELEAIIAALVKVKSAAKVDSAEWRFAVRQLSALRYSYENAGPIWEGLDDYWYATPLEETKDPEGQLLPRRRTSVSDQE